MDLQLPKGLFTIEDQLIVHYLVSDPIFKKSAEDDMGPISRIYPDWQGNKLVYVTLTGEESHDLRALLDYAIKIGYLNSFKN